MTSEIFFLGFFATFFFEHEKTCMHVSDKGVGKGLTGQSAEILAELQKKVAALTPMSSDFSKIIKDSAESLAESAWDRRELDQSE